MPERDREKADSIVSELRAVEGDPVQFGSRLLSLIAGDLQICQAGFFLAFKDKERKYIRMISGYAIQGEDPLSREFEFGEGLAGQVANDGKPSGYTNVPEGYISVFSGLGRSTPGVLHIHPFCDGMETLAVIELASFTEFDEKELALLDSLQQYVAGVCRNFVHSEEDNHD